MLDFLDQHNIQHTAVYYLLVIVDFFRGYFFKKTYIGLIV